MKIIYIPVVIPVNIRTFFALVGCLLAGILLIVGVATQSWMLVELRANNESITTTQYTRIVGYQGLQFVDVYYCTRSAYYRGDFCDAQHVVYTECDDAKDSWCRGRAGFLVTFACGIVAALLALVSIGVGLVREMRHGIMGLLAAAIAISGSVAYAGAYATAMRGGLLDSIEATAGSAVVVNKMGYGFYCYMFGTCILFMSGVTSASLYICAAHGKENRARHPPKVSVVHMNAASTTQLAPNAPAPGFVQLSSDSRFSLEDGAADDDEELVVPPPSQSSSAAPPSLGQPRGGEVVIAPPLGHSLNPADVSPTRRQHTLAMGATPITPEMATQTTKDGSEHET